MASAVERAYNVGLGKNPQRGPEAEFLVIESGSTAEALLVSGHLTKAANLPTFLQFGNAKNQIFVIFAKNHRWPQNLAG